MVRKVELAIMGLGLVMGILIGLFIMDGSVDSDPMPCGEHEVYVWIDYPNKATCKDEDDHAGHMGG